jgi:Fe-S oxidoreductase
MAPEEIAMSKRKIFEMPECSGCGTCEMVCSFTHSGAFNPSVSAIKVLNKGDGRGFLISLAEERDGEGLECIACLECTQSCPAARDLEKIIETFGRKE